MASPDSLAVPEVEHHRTPSQESRGKDDKRSIFLAEQAIRLCIACNYEEAEKILQPRRNENPRFAVEYAFLVMLKGFMYMTNENREELLELFLNAGRLATKMKYGQDTMADDDDEGAEDLMTEDFLNSLPEKERKKLMEKKEKADAKQREKDKAAFKEKMKTSGKESALDQTWKLECEVIYADALMGRAMIQLQLQQYIRGALNLRKAWQCYLALKKIMDEDKNGQMPDDIKLSIMFGCGVFFCYLSLVPGGLMRILSAIGFIADQETGEEYLTTVINADNIRSPSAALILLTYYLFLPTGLGDVTKTLEKAKAILDKMNAIYPENSYFHAYANFYHRKRGETEEALNEIRLSISSLERYGSNTPLLMQYLLADTLYMDQQFTKARAQYNVVLEILEDTGVTFSYTGQVVLSLAACYVWEGDFDNAMVWVKRVPNMFNPKSRQDMNSPKMAQRIVNEPDLLPLLGVYILYINRDLAHMKPDGVQKMLRSLVKLLEGKDTTKPEMQCMYHLFLGVMHNGCGRKVTAMDHWEKALALEKKLKADSLALPYLYYELGESEFRGGNLEKAKMYLDKGSGLKGDGHETLSNRYNIALRQIDKAMKKAKK